MAKKDPYATSQSKSVPLETIPEGTPVEDSTGVQEGSPHPSSAPPGQAASPETSQEGSAEVEHQDGSCNGVADIQVSASSFAPLPPGLHVYLGTTGVGKSYKAFEEAKATALHDKRTLLVVDSGGAENFGDFPHAQTLREAVQATWEKPGGPPVYYTPDEDDEFDGLMEACKDVGGIILFIDEVSFWASRPSFKKLCRMWRHAKITILVTCQTVGYDLSQALLACNPTFYIFKLSGPTALEWCERWHNLPPDFVRNMKDREYVIRRF